MQPLPWGPPARRRNALKASSSQKSFSVITLKTTVSSNKQQGHTQAVSLSSPTCCLSRVGIFTLGTEKSRAPSVAAIHAHTLLALWAALSKAHLAQLDIQGSRNSSLVQLQELLVLSPLFSSSRPAKTWAKISAVEDLELS